MIIAATAAILLIFGGGGLSQYLVNSDKAIKKTIEDKTPRNEILAITKELSKDLKKERKAYTKAMDDLLDLPQDFGVSPAVFDQQIEKMMTIQQQLIDTTLDARDQMHQRMTPEQWHAVFKKKTK